MTFGEGIVTIDNIRNKEAMIGDMDMMAQIGLDLMKESIDEILGEEDGSECEQYRSPKSGEKLRRGEKGA